MSLLWNFTDVWVTLRASSRGTVFGLYNESGRIRLPPFAMEAEFFGNYDPRAPDPFDYGSTELPPACLSEQATASIPQLFVMTARLTGFQMYDQLRHGVGTFERFSRAVPGARTPSVSVLAVSGLTNFPAPPIRNASPFHPDAPSGMRVRGELWRVS